MKLHKTIAQRAMYTVLNHEDLYTMARHTLRFVREYGMVSWIDFEDGSRLCIDDNGKVWACEL